MRIRAAWKGATKESLQLLDRPEVLSMPRSLTDANGNLPDTKRPGSKTLAKFPELDKWLSDSKYDDGKPVGMVQLSCRPKGALYVLTLRIQDHGGMQIAVEDVSLDDALMCLEASLMANPVPWQRDPYPLGQITGKRK